MTQARISLEESLAAVHTGGAILAVASVLACPGIIRELTIRRRRVQAQSASEDRQETRRKELHNHKLLSRL